MNTQNNAGGVGISGLLGIAFIILKLIGTIAWSWLWVLSPFWIPAAFILIVLFIIIIVVIIKTLKER